MKILIIEDDPGSQKVLCKFLSEYGKCDTASTGTDGVNAFIDAFHLKQPYDLVCLDIMMPKMDGHQILEAIRRVENDNGVHGLDGVKVIMTTALGDSKNVMGAFRKGCEAYLVKPIKKEKLLDEMEKLGLIKPQTSK